MVIGKTMKEVEERYNRLNINLSSIVNKEGNRNVRKMIVGLKFFIDNPNIILKHEIDNSSDIKKQTLRWIAGEVG